MARFSTRTLVLMVLTLVAFGWFYWRMHQRAGLTERQVPKAAMEREGVIFMTVDGGTP